MTNFMIKELISVIRDNNLNTFDNSTPVKSNGLNLFLTKDAKAIHQKVLRHVSSNFVFPSTSELWSAFPLTNNLDIIKRRQDFFSGFKNNNFDNSFLKSLKKPKNWWKPKYGILVVTEDEKTYLSLTKANCPAPLLLTDNDLVSLESYDLVQVVDCDNFISVLERLPQTVFLNSLDDAYLERYLEILSGWSENINILKNSPINDNVKSIISQFDPLIPLLSNESFKKLTLDEVEKKLEEINEGISSKLSNMNLSGSSVFGMLSGGKMPESVISIIDSEISSSGIPSHLLKAGIPVRLDDLEFEKFVKSQDANEFTSIAEKVKKNSQILRKVPALLGELSSELLLFDFFSGINKFVSSNDHHVIISNDHLRMIDINNIFLDKPQPINFSLDNNNKCSLLTGANSGGKTTLIEHILQLISLSQLGLPVRGKLEIPLFTEIYYFAKNKGSMSKGAFETLLTQMSEIKPGKKTIILADEIEAVTEPGVAGKLICATAEYFINKDCFVIIATHLGQEIKDNIPNKARIDGIEAKGLSADNKLIVDHNPVLGRLARSTPELIIEKMSRTSNHEYFKMLWEKMKK